MDNLNTVKKIVLFIKPKIDAYRQFPENEKMIISELNVVFDIKSTSWPKVIKDGTFVESFRKELGKARMTVLKKLLCNLDEKHYSNVVF